MRLKDGVTNAKIFSNTITNCGIHDYMFESGDMNGQGVCIGTSSDEVKKTVRSRERRQRKDALN